MNRLTRTEDLMSSDDSDDDNYNYLTALDNLNWNCKAREGKDRAEAESEDRKGWAKPAVAVRPKGNRTDALLKDMIASERDKSKDMTTSKSDNTCASNKRDLEDISEEDNDLSIFSDNICQLIDNKNNNNNNNNNNNSTNYAIPKNKKQKVNQMTESEYSMSDLLLQKKANHQKSINNNNKNDLNRVKSADRLFGKAFSPTVYSPEVPVMRALVPPISAQIHRNSMTLNEDLNQMDSKYNPNHILAVILDWNTKWLTECIPNEVPPPLSPYGEGIGVKSCYESLDEYQSAYIPLILFETWAQIYDDFHKNKSKRKGQDVFKAVVAPDYGSDDHFITVSMQTAVPKSKMKSLNYASEGYLVLVELAIDYSANNEHKKLVLFGYVSDYNVETITSNTSLLPGLVVAPTHTSSQLLLKYTVQLSKKPIRISPREPVTVRTIHYLKPTMRQIELIAGLNICPLFKDILRPRAFTCQVVVPSNVRLNTTNFNEGQSRAILGSSEALNRPYAVPKLLLIQGPPGTGKTHTLIGIIKQIYMKWDTPDHLPRILICAPSNGAVDEIARRLYSERRFLQKHKCDRALRCVRVGQSSQIHADVRRISLETLIEENADNEDKRFQTQKQKQSHDLEARVARLDQEMADLRSAPNRKNDLVKLELEMQKLMIEMNKVSQTPKPTDWSKSRLRMDLMTKADIVLSTLNSCHQSPIENLFKSFGNKTFDCVIVDEASQCSEPELLMPLAYRTTKMILIGDPMQLPATVISKKASSLQLGRSLFERFFHYFRECEQNDPKQKSPILMLTEQYRMHPQICEFPSNQFYDGRLTSSAKVQNRNFKLKPYIVFDLTDTQESRSDPTNKFNESEANFVVRLVEIIDQLMGSADSQHKHSIGVITPYNGQKNFVSNKIENKKLKTNVEVNTVDGFQGQERDVIILSCVRAFDSQSPSHVNSIGFLNSVQRMNVALTRAKYSMIVCISGRSLESDKNWRALIDNAMKRTNCRFKVTSTLATDKLKRMIERIEVIDVDLKSGPK